MKNMKQWFQITSLLLLALCIFTSCTPSVPSDLTAPPSESTSEPKVHEPTALDGIGTICYIGKFDDGYAVLTHKGWYYVDREFQEHRRMDAPYNDPFDHYDDYSFFKRVLAFENYEPPFFSRGSAQDESLYFYCSATQSLYIDGVQTDLSSYGVRMQYCAFFDTTWHNGAFYTCICSDGQTYLFRGGEEMTEITDKFYIGLFETGEELYLYGWESCSDFSSRYIAKVNDDFTIGEPKLCDDEMWETVNAKFYDKSAAGESAGKYRYRFDRTEIRSEADENGESEVLGQHYTLCRTDGKTVETLECDGIDYLFGTADRFFFFVKNDCQVCVITINDGVADISILDFHVSQ